MMTNVAVAQDPASPISLVPITLTFNGQVRSLNAESWTTLLDLLREREQLTGTKEGPRPRPVRRVHGAGGRQADEQLPDPRRFQRRGQHHHD